MKILLAISFLLFATAADAQTQVDTLLRGSMARMFAENPFVTLQVRKSTVAVETNRRMEQKYQAPFCQIWLVYVKVETATEYQYRRKAFWTMWSVLDYLNGRGGWTDEVRIVGVISVVRLVNLIVTEYKAKELTPEKRYTLEEK